VYKAALLAFLYYYLASLLAWSFLRADLVLVNGMVELRDGAQALDLRLRG
jgi:hypothetical protein